MKVGGGYDPCLFTRDRAWYKLLLVLATNTTLLGQ